jgi:phosphonate transport system permease protein
MPADLLAKRRNANLIFLALVSLLTAGSIVITKYDVLKGFTGIVKACAWGFANFYPDVKAWRQLPDLLNKLGKQC